MKKWYKYQVRTSSIGYGDMLDLADMFRYDHGYLKNKPTGQRNVTVYSPVSPAIGRWESFSAVVEKLETCPKPKGEKMWTAIRDPQTQKLEWIEVTVK